VIAFLYWMTEFGPGDLLWSRIAWWAIAFVTAGISLTALGALLIGWRTFSAKERRVCQYPLPRSQEGVTAVHAGPSGWTVVARSLLTPTAEPGALFPEPQEDGRDRLGCLMTRRVFAIGLIFGLGFAAGCWATGFTSVDRCLDGGGRWNYERRLCEVPALGSEETNGNRRD
jgi:hypothetical protein